MPFYVSDPSGRSVLTPGTGTDYPSQLYLPGGKVITLPKGTNPDYYISQAEKARQTELVIIAILMALAAIAAFMLYRIVRNRERIADGAITVAAVALKEGQAVASRWRRLKQRVRDRAATLSSSESRTPH